MKDLTNQYNGYLFGNAKKYCKIYNPWSIAHAILEKQIKKYWNDTGSPSHLISFFEKSNDHNKNLNNISLLLDKFQSTPSNQKKLMLLLKMKHQYHILRRLLILSI